jgi:hypothetical protein
VNDADGDLALLFERDQGGPERNAPDEVPGAVDGIDDPPSILRASWTKLFSKKSLIWS